MDASEVKAVLVHTNCMRESKLLGPQFDAVLLEIHSLGSAQCYGVCAPARCMQLVLWPS